jgi:thiamine biosynthesis lipoprotein
MPGMVIDLGGIAKGYAIDRGIEVLRERGVTMALMNAGGDLRCLGTKADGTPWRIGVQNPREKTSIVGVIKVSDGAVATSGDYERYFLQDGVRYHHLLDPATGMPARACQSVTIVAQTAEMADVMATAVFVMGPERGLAFIRDHPDIEGMIIRADGEMLFSEGFVFQPN